MTRLPCKAFPNGALASTGHPTVQLEANASASLTAPSRARLPAQAQPRDPGFYETHFQVGPPSPTHSLLLCVGREGEKTWHGGRGPRRTLGVLGGRGRWGLAGPVPCSRLWQALR